MNDNPRTKLGSDMCHSKDGAFSIKETYSYLSNKDSFDNPMVHNFKTIRNQKGPQCIRTFLYKLAHHRLLTNEERKKINRTKDNSFPICSTSPESIIHVLQDCDTSKQFQSDIIDQHSWSKFMSLRYDDWLSFNLKNNKELSTDISWNTMFRVVVYHLWGNEIMSSSLTLALLLLSYCTRSWPNQFLLCKILVAYLCLQSNIGRYKFIFSGSPHQNVYKVKC